MTQRRRAPAGSRPGTLVIPADSPPPHIHVFEYGRDESRETDISDPSELARFIQSEDTTWVDVQGFGDESALWTIAEVFGLHALTLEAATNIPQRAHCEVRNEHLLAIARLPDRDDNGGLEVPQVCMILGSSWILTFQDRYFGFFDCVRERIREGVGPIRTAGPDYLFYALLDALVDRYFPIAEDLSARVEDLEEQVHHDPRPEALRALHAARRDLVILRRVGQPQLDALRALNLRPEPFVREETAVYLRSTEQHLSQGMGIVEAAREHASSVVDLYLSNVSHRTNEVMKVLTLMASIFIPLTFIAGVYGMNFESMPELHQPLGYPVALGVMGIVAGVMIVWFRRKGWLGRRPPAR